MARRAKPRRAAARFSFITSPATSGSWPPHWKAPRRRYLASVEPAGAEGGVADRGAEDESAGFGSAGRELRAEAVRQALLAYVALRVNAPLCRDRTSPDDFLHLLGVDLQPMLAFLGSLPADERAAIVDEALRREARINLAARGDDPVVPARRACRPLLPQRLAGRLLSARPGALRRVHAGRCRPAASPRGAAQGAAGGRGAGPVSPAFSRRTMRRQAAFPRNRRTPSCVARGDLAFTRRGPHAVP